MFESRRLCAAVLVAIALVFMGCGSGSNFEREIGSISLETETVPDGGAGQLYNTVVEFGMTGSAAPPDRFELDTGTLPPGVELVRDREDLDLDGIPDPAGAYTGDARLIGFPRDAGSHQFTLRAISTGALAPGGPNARRSGGSCSDRAHLHCCSSLYQYVKSTHPH